MAKITAISSLGWSHYTLYEALPKMKERGFQRIEIASFVQYCSHFNFGNPTPKELYRLLQNLNLEPICLNYSPRHFQAWKEDEIDNFVRDWERKLPHLVEVGIPMMTMPFGERNVRSDQEFQLSNAIKAFDRVGEIASKLGIKMLIEAPHLYSIMPQIENVLWVVNRLSSENVGVLLDSSHWGIIKYDIDEYLNALGDRLWHVHLRDSMGPDTADRKQQLELTPGKGTTDFKLLSQALDRVAYKGDISLEFEYRNISLNTIENEYDQGLQYLLKTNWEIPHSVKY